MKCSKCGEKLKNHGAFCPNCGAEILPKKQNVHKSLSKNAKAVIACVCVVALLISGTVGGLYFFRNHTDNLTDPDSNYISITEGFTDVLVTDEESALEAIKSVDDVIGIENVDDELKISNINTVDSDTYYRFQQYYNDIPVYGNSIVISADNDSDATALTSNFVPITEDISLEPCITQNQVDIAVKKYLKYDDIEIEKIGDENLVIYNTDNKYVLAYELSVNGLESVIVDADTSKVINYRPLFNDIAAEVVAENDNNINAIGWKNDDGSYHLYNDQYKISVFDVNNITTYIEDGSLYHIDFKEYQKGFLFKKNIDTLYSKNNKFEKSAVQALNEFISISEFYNDLGDSGFDRFHVAINDSYDNGNNARGLGGNDDIKWGLVLLGKNYNFDEKDVFAHEYTHAIAGKIINWSGSVNMETSALNEAYSDIFGSLYENQINPDWEMIHLSQMIRDITDPHHTGGYANMSDIKKSDNYNQYTLSTIISHSAYLMWNGIDGNEQGKIDANTLAKIWYRSLFLLQSDATFSQCRNAVELSARSLWKSGKLTEKQYDTVIQAFNEVGIDRVSNYVNKTLKNDFNMLVLNSEGKEHVSAEIKIYPSATSSNVFFANKNKVVFEETFNSTSPEEGIHINLKDGRYLVEISDTATEKSTEPIGMIIEVDGNSKVATDNLTVYTDFKEITTVVLNNEKIDLNTIYINFLSSKGYNDLITNWYEVTPTDYAVIDINQDGKEELIVSGSQGFLSFYSFAIFGYDAETNSVFCYTYDIDDGITGNIKHNDGLLQYYGSLRYSSKYKALMYSATNDGINNHYFSFDSLKDKKIHTEFMLAMETEYDTQIRSYYTNDTKIDEATYNAFIDELKPIEWTKIPNFESSNEGASPSKDGSTDVGKFYGNDTPEQLRKSIIGSWGALGSIVSEYNFIDSKNCSGSMPWQANGTYSISDDKALIISWAGKSESEKYIWSSETWDEFYSHSEHDVYFWYMTDDGVLMLNGKEKYRKGVDNFTYNTDGDLMAAISGTWIGNNGFKEYRINSDGTWEESTVVVSGGTLISRTTIDNGKVEIIDNTTAKLWQETKSLSQIPGASELVYDSKNDKIFVGGTNNSFTRVKYK